jgi:hypothetical protein
MRRKKATWEIMYGDLNRTGAFIEFELIYTLIRTIQKPLME